MAAIAARRARTQDAFAFDPETRAKLDIANAELAALEHAKSRPDRSGWSRAQLVRLNAQWDAQVAGDATGEPGEILYITAVDGNTLKVSKTRPA